MSLNKWAIGVLTCAIATRASAQEKQLKRSDLPAAVRGGRIATEDLAAALTYIFRNADALGVTTADYSLWGSSAGARGLNNELCSRAQTVE